MSYKIIKKHFHTVGPILISYKILKKYFHTTRPLRAVDPITGLSMSVAYTPSAPYIGMAIIYTWGFCFILWGIFCTNHIDIDLTTTIEFGDQYIEHFRSLDSNIWLRLHEFDRDMLIWLLREYEIIIQMHELAFGQSSSLINYLEASDNPLFDDADQLFEDWRELGNTILRTYRDIERLLDIPADESRIEYPQWYED